MNNLSAIPQLFIELNNWFHPMNSCNIIFRMVALAHNEFHIEQTNKKQNNSSSAAAKSIGYNRAT